MLGISLKNASINIIRISFFFGFYTSSNNIIFVICRIKSILYIVFNNNSQNNWLGITFRLSKTFINFINEIPYFYNSERILKLANNEETKEFYKLRKNENTNIDFKWPNLDYTINKSDLINL